MPMPNMNPMAFLNQMLSQNPNLKNNPQIQNLQQMVQAGDFQGVQQLGQNLCNSFNTNPQEVLNQVKPNLPFF